MARREIYVSTDVEADGPIPGPHSMLSFASVAFADDGVVLATYSANLATLDGATAPADATRARELKRQAIVAYDKSIAINEALQQRLMGHP